MTARPLQLLLQRLRRTAQQASAHEPSDGELLGRFVARADPAAFEALVRRHGAMVLGVCRRVLRHEADAEDAFQATFLLLARKAASVAPRSQVGCWLYGVARTTAVRARDLARRRRRKEREAALARPTAVGDPDRSEVAELLDREVGRLPAKYRAVAVLCDLEGVPLREAAHRLGCPPGTVASRRARARALLGKRLLRAGLTAPAAAAAVTATAVEAAAVPVRLIAQTVAGALATFGGQAAGAVSAPVAALVAGGLRAMIVTRLMTAGALVVALGTAGAGVGVMARQAPAPGAGGQAKASSPAEGQDAEKRLRAIEEKLEQISKQIAPQPPAAVPQNIERALELLNAARDTLNNKIEAQMQAYKEFRKRLPLRLRTANGTVNLYAERLLAIDKRRTELRIKKAEMEKQFELIKQAYTKEGPAAAMYLINAAGVKIQLAIGADELDKLLLKLRADREVAVTYFGPQHPNVQQIDKAIELTQQIYGRVQKAAAEQPKRGQGKGRESEVVETHIKVMEAEIKNCDALLQTLDELFDKEQKQARELNDFELEEQRYQDSIKSGQNLYDAIVKTLSEINLLRESGQPRDKK
jgi:RNA polymerase sigma factor (sigma-70 family)